MTPLQVGDPVTVFYSVNRDGDRTPVSHARVVEIGLVFRGWQMFAYDADDNARIRQRRRVDREGVTWIRGHHSSASPEVKAALAAWSLLQDEFLQPLKEKGT